MHPDPRLRALADEIALRHNAHVVDLVQRGDRSRQVVEVYLDNETGVTADLCSAVSRELVTAVDAGVIVPGNYRLEVSSPGIDRPLRHPWQFPKHVGRTLRVRVQTPEGPRDLRGGLVRVEESGIVLKFGEGDHLIPFADIQDARVQAPW
jgi:ribosome maturation factor RimP